jgi:hypothetical protein
MSRRKDLPAGWRQPPETTAEPVPMRRPYLDRDSGSWLPSPAPNGMGPTPPRTRGAAPVPRPPAAAGPRNAAPPPRTSISAPQAVPRTLPPQAVPRTPPPQGVPRIPSPQGVPRIPPPQAVPRTPSPQDQPPQPRASRPPAMRRWRPMRGVIGDGNRTPMLWCEFGNCIHRYIDPTATSDRDLCDQAIAAGWRYDELGRLACPSCAGNDPAFRAIRS